jgi:hypothetical protein
MNLTQWLIACAFVSWVSFRFGAIYGLSIANRMVEENNKKQSKYWDEINVDFDKLTEMRRECDRIRFENQTRANAN